MAPVIRALAGTPALEPVVCVTDQHREMLDEVLEFFDIRPDHRLGVMRDGQSPTEVAARVLQRLPPVLVKVDPAAVLVQGDTTTTLAAALAAFYCGIPIGHIEAGLRTRGLRWTGYASSTSGLRSTRSRRARHSSRNGSPKLSRRWAVTRMSLRPLSPGSRASGPEPVPSFSAAQRRASITGLPVTVTFSGGTPSRSRLSRAHTVGAKCHSLMAVVICRLASSGKGTSFR